VIKEARLFVHAVLLETSIVQLRNKRFASSQDPGKAMTTQLKVEKSISGERLCRGFAEDRLGRAS
jgi:hypothetical protein